jgi:hypothetical protein
VSNLTFPPLSEVPTVDPAALLALPIFPLPSTLLLPQTIVSLHVFEPRYRRMMEDILEGHRAMAIAMLDEGGPPDLYGRPPVFPVAGVGVLRRSARLPDGRFNILIEGVLRANISKEMDPRPDLPYRRVRAEPLSDVYSATKEQIASATNALRALTARVVTEIGGTDNEVIERLGEIDDPGTLADMIAAATVQDVEDRQRILSEVDVIKRIELASGALGALLLKASKPAPAWGGSSGQA